MGKKRYTRNELFDLIKSGAVLRIGFLKATIPDEPKFVKFRDGWFDLSGGDHQARQAAGGILLNLWFYFDVNCRGMISERMVPTATGIYRQIKIPVHISWEDIDYIWLDDDRIYIDLCS